MLNNSKMRRKQNNSEKESEKNKRLKQSSKPKITQKRSTNYPVEQNIFRGSIESIRSQKIIEEANIKNHLRIQLTSWMGEFQFFLNTLPIHNSINISSFSKKNFTRPSRDLRFVKNIANHSKNNLSCDEDISITFIRPECVGTFGLFKIDALPGPNIEMNLHMTIPKKCFHIDDSLNNRYFIKKFFYLMYLAEHLKSENICSSIKCAYYNENVFLPYLILCPNINEKIIVKMFLIPEPKYFDAATYSPEANNIRAQVFEQDLGIIENIQELSSTFYNASLGFDATLAENNVVIEQWFSTSISFQEGLKLIVIWMNKKRLNYGLGAFTTDLAIYFMVYLITRRKVNKTMGPYEIFRKFLYFMYTIDLAQTPISICEEISQEKLEKYKTFFDLVLMDNTGTYNTAAFLNIDAYSNMKHECKMALDILDEDSSLFSALLSTHVPLYLQYDAIIDVKKDNNYEYLLKNIEPKEKLKYVGNRMLLIIKMIQKYLNEGFNKRVINIVPIITSDTEWRYGDRHKISNCRILFGLQLNPELAFDILESAGPVTEAKKNNFKEFWKDFGFIEWFHGGTSEKAFQFKAENMKSRRDIIKTIADYVMTDKLHLDHKLYYNELEYFLLNGKMDATNEETSRKIAEYSDDLGEKIKSLDFQSRIVHIGEISDIFCYTNVFPPVPSFHKRDGTITSSRGCSTILKDQNLKVPLRYVEPVECVIQLALGSECPKDLKILGKMEIAFGVRISELLRNQFNVISSLKPPYLDVLYKGLVFRYNIFISEEIDLMERHWNDAPHYEAISEFKRNNLVKPKIVAALKCINSRNPSYGVSTCLAKRWIRAQLIDDFLLPDMVINLLNAHGYLHKSSYEPSVVPHQAFLRFLKFLIEVHWDEQPVVVNLNNGLLAENISKIRTAMSTNREGFPALVILTPYDDCNSVFTQTAPCKEVLVRLKVLATGFLNCVQNMILDETLYSWKELFIPNKRGYNCILHLKSLSNPRIQEQVTMIDINSEDTLIEPSEGNLCLPLVDFNPVQMYLKELRTTYGEYCVFFHDSYGGSYIGVLWKPGLLEFKEDIMRGFQIFGRDVLQSIDVK